MGLPIPPNVTIPVPPTPAPSTIGGGDSWVSGVMSGLGYAALAAACTLTQAGTLSIQRYIDMAGTIAIGAAITQEISASTPATVSVNDGLPFATWIVTITNTSGSSGTLTDVALLMSFY